MALRIKQELSDGVAPRTVLFVDEPELLLEGIVFSRGTASRFHDLRSSHNARHTEVLVRARKRGQGDFPPAFRIRCSDSRNESFERWKRSMNGRKRRSLSTPDDKDEITRAVAQTD
jgi:hypothetical protein